MNAFFNRTLRRLVVAVMALAPFAVYSAETERPKPLTMQLDWRLNAQFAGLLVAERDALYREADLAVEIRPLGDVPYERFARHVAETEGMIGSIEGGLFLSGRAAGQEKSSLDGAYHALGLGDMAGEPLIGHVAQRADFDGKIGLAIERVALGDQQTRELGVEPPVQLHGERFRPLRFRRINRERRERHDGDDQAAKGPVEESVHWRGFSAMMKAISSANWASL